MFICDNLKIEVKIMNKLIAISTNGSNSIALVKSVNEQEYKKLINEQEKNLSKGEKKAREHEEQHEKVNNDIRHFMELGCVLAKNTYDNLVDRGQLEEDEAFQKNWLSFLKNEMSLEKFVNSAPQDFVNIYEKIRGMGYEKGK